MVWSGLVFDFLWQHYDENVDNQAMVVVFQLGNVESKPLAAREHTKFCHVFTGGWAVLNALVQLSGAALVSVAGIFAGNPTCDWYTSSHTQSLPGVPACHGALLPS